MLLSAEQNKKLDTIKNAQKLSIGRKFENSMIRVSEKNSSIFLIGNGSSCTFNE